MEEKESGGDEERVNHGEVELERSKRKRKRRNDGGKKMGEST